MIKRLLLALALVVVPIVAAAQSADRDTLLTTKGTLFTVESVFADQAPEVTTRAAQFLVLTIQAGDKQTQINVPASLEDGAHTSPALAYDSDSNTLFVFWERGVNNRLSSELVFCSYHEGTWSEPVAIDAANYQRSRNLRIGVTRKVLTENRDGEKILIPELTVHAAWWNEAGNGESARYAMLTIGDGGVVATSVYPLADFGNTSVELSASTSQQPLNTDILQQPVLLENPGRETVDVIYGDARTNTLRKVTLQPVANGRLRVPVGRVERIGSPKFLTEANGRVGAVSSGSSLALFIKGKSALHYSLYTAGEWSEMHSINTSGKVTTEAAVEAVRRLANE
jgi:hypothetical protein